MYVDDEQQNCRFDRGNNRFVYRAGAIIIENGCVLLVTNAAADYYYTVGGGIHFDETAEQAVLREVKEETGVDYEVDRLVFVNEAFFTEECGVHKGKDFHEVAMYFLMKPRGTQEIHSDSYCCDGKETLEWVALSKLKSVKVYPEFFADRLTNLPDGVEYIMLRRK